MSRRCDPNGRLRPIATTRWSAIPPSQRGTDDELLTLGGARSPRSWSKAIITDAGDRTERVRALIGDLRAARTPRGRRIRRVSEDVEVPIHPGEVAWTGENPGIYLKEREDGPWSA